MKTYFAREIGEGDFYAVCEEIYKSAQKSPEMDTCIKYRCFHCGDIDIRNGVIVHLETCTIGADDRLNEALYMCDFLYEHMVSNGLSLPRVNETYMKMKKKYEWNL